MKRSLSADRILAGFVSVAAMTGTAHAADMAPVYKAPPAVVAPVYNWTGFYIGGHAGWAWTDKTWRLSGNEVADYTADGGFAGGQVGFNWQTGPWVLGAEAQASWSHIRKGVVWVDPEVDPWIEPGTDPVRKPRTGTTVDNLGSIAGRVGYAFDRVLVFAKGGGAWAHDDYRAFNANTANERLIASASGTRWGWMAGGGLEYGLTPNWSAKVEFDYFDFGSDRITLVSVPGVTPPTRAFDVEQTIALVKLGINYRFGGPM